MDLRKSNIVLLSGYRGETDFRVTRGPWTGTRISARPLKPQWYLDDYKDNIGRVWYSDFATYQREVMTTVGLVRAAGRFAEPVPDALVAEVNSYFSLWRESNPDLAYGELVAGIYVPTVGWMPAAQKQIGQSGEHASPSRGVAPDGQAHKESYDGQNLCRL